MRVGTKLTMDQRVAIVAERASGHSYREIGEKYGISGTHVRRSCMQERNTFDKVTRKRDLRSRCTSAYRGAQGDQRQPRFLTGRNHLRRDGNVCHRGAAGGGEQAVTGYDQGQLSCFYADRLSGDQADPAVLRRAPRLPYPWGARGRCSLLNSPTP